MAGLFAMGDLSHDLETLLLHMADGLLPRTAETYGLVQSAFDELHVLRDQISGRVSGDAVAGPRGAAGRRTSW